MILYVGNYLTKHGYTPTFNEILSLKLKESYTVRRSSDRLNQAARLFSMVYSVFRYRKKAEIVLIDSYSTRAFWFLVCSSIAARICRVPYVTILRGGYMENRLKRNPRLCKMVFGKSFSNISPSLHMLKIFTEHGFEVKYIPNHLELEKYSYERRKKIRLKLFYLRSLHKIYNPLMAVDILKKLVDKYGDAELCMVGPDKDGSRQEMEDRADELGVRNKIKFTGRLDKPGWRKLSQDYDIFINTTNVDNHPVSVIEAMALGLVVVSTNAGGMPFLIESGQEGYLVRPQDPDAFIEKISLLYEHPELAVVLTDNARKKVEDFDWLLVKENFFEIIKNATGQLPGQFEPEEAGF